MSFFFPTCITYLETHETRGVSQITYLCVESVSAQSAFTLQTLNKRLIGEIVEVALVCSLTLASDSELTYYGGTF